MVVKYTMLNKKEKLWISRAKRLFRDKPEKLLLYTTDGEISICKRGISSYEFSASIPDSEINCGCVITDMHDDMGRGE